MLTDISVRSVTGSELELYICNPVVQIAFATKLAPGGSEDISQRIRDFYRIPKNLPANYIARFVQLSKMTGDAREAISILAPHTHWSYLRPIVYKFDSSHERYIVGLHAIEPDKRYRPVSFIAFKGEVLAYEWLDESVTLCESLWSKAVPKIHSILQNSVYDDEPISLGVDFRFRNKETFDGSLDDSGSVEFPVYIRNAEDQEFSLIVSGLVAQGIDFGDRESLTVGWPCSAIGNFELPAEKLRLFECLCNMLTEISNVEDRAMAVSSILDELRMAQQSTVKPTC